MDKGKLVLLLGFLIIIIALVLDKGFGLLSDLWILIVYGSGVITLIIGLIMGNKVRY